MRHAGRPSGFWQPGGGLYGSIRRGRDVIDEKIGVLEGVDLEGMDEEVKWLAVVFSVGGVDPPFEGATGQERLRVEKNHIKSSRGQLAFRSSLL